MSYPAHMRRCADGINMEWDEWEGEGDDRKLLTLQTLIGRKPQPPKNEIGCLTSCLCLPLSWLQNW